MTTYTITGVPPAQPGGPSQQAWQPNIQCAGPYSSLQEAERAMTAAVARGWITLELRAHEDDE
jgi:hypothetical protein